MRSSWPLALAAFVYLAVRAWVLLTDFDGNCHPSYELTIVGNIAHACRNGWTGPALSDYYDNCGGHLVCGLLAAPLYALFGESYLTLKLVPLLFGLATLALAWLLLAPRVGRAGAGVAVLFLAAGPPTLMRLSLLSMGSHHEGLLLFAATYLAWLLWLETGARTRAGLVFGLCAGFAVFFYFGTLLWLALLALTHLLVRGPRRALVDGARAAGGFVVGAIPLVWVTLATNGRPLRFLAANLGSQARPGPGEAVSRALELATDVLPRAGSFPALGPLPGAAGEALLLGAFLSAWMVVVLALLRPARAAPELTRPGSVEQRLVRLRFLPLVLYLPALLGTCALSRFRIASGPPSEVLTLRYLAPHLLVAALLTGVAVGRLLAGPRPRPVLAGGLSACALATAAFVLALEGPGASTHGARHAGWSGRYLARVLLRDGLRDPATGQLTWNPDRLLRQIERLPANERPDVCEGLGYFLAWSRTEQPLSGLDGLSGPLPGRLRVALARGVGSFLRAQVSAGKLSTDQLRRFLEHQGAEERALYSSVVQGLALEFEFPLACATAAEITLDLELEGAVPAGLRHPWAQGLGLAFGRALGRGVPAQLDAWRARLPEIAARDPGAFRSGVAEARMEPSGRLR